MKQTHTLKFKSYSCSKNDKIVKIQSPNVDISDTFSSFNKQRFVFFGGNRQIIRHMTPDLRKIKGKNLQLAKKKDKYFYDFHDEYCVNYLAKLDNKTTIAPNQFIEKILQNKENNLFFIEGDVGVGKSTYISSSLRYLENIKENKKRTENAIAIVVNFSESFLNAPISISFENHLVNIMVEKTIIYFEPLKSKLNACNSFEDLFSLLTGKLLYRKIIYIFDNLDGIYDDSIKNILKTEYDKAHFLQWIGNDNKRTLTEVCRSLVKNFNKIYTQKLETIFQGVNIVIAARPETSRNIFSGNVHLNECNSHIKRIYLENDDEFVLSVIEKRVEMLRKCKKIDKRNHAKNLQYFIKESAKHKLHGLRNIVMDVSLLLNKDCNIQSEGNHPNWVYDIFLYLDNNTNYAQNGKSGIANLFLINYEFRLSEENNKTGSYPRNVLKPHKHSYWLKYFIAHIFHYQGISPFLAYKSLLNKYDEHIYKLCTYSLCEVRQESEIKHGRLLHCISSTEGHYSLESDKRLDYIINNKYDLLFGFIYLSVVIDDPYMQYPEIDCIKNVFVTRYKKDYTDLFCDLSDDSNKECWFDWLKTYFYKVLLFIKILRYSWINYEKELVDEELHEYIPDFDKIEENIQKEAFKIATTDLGVSKNEATRILTIQQEKSKECENQISDFFTEHAKTL